MPPRRSHPLPARQRTSAASRRRLRIAWLPLVVCCAIVSAGVMAVIGLRTFVLESSYFAVRELRATTGLHVPLARSLLGHNMWRVDLATVQQTTSQANPTFKAVRVWRQWPQRIVVEATPRTPVAQVRSSRYYPVDAEGFVMHDGAITPLARLTVLDGVESPMTRLVPGRINRSERLMTGLAALLRLRSSRELRGHLVQRMDCSQPSQITVYLDDGLEVRLGPLAEWPRRLPQLRKTLEMLVQKQLTPAYVDLRFGEDPIIGPPR